MLQRLEELRQEINRMIASGEYYKAELVKKSQELDAYIVHAMQMLAAKYRKPDKG